MAVGTKIEDIDHSAASLDALIGTALAHPLAFLCVVLAVAFILCFLPSGVVKQIIIHRTEMKKLEHRVDQSRKKLSAGRQNRAKR